MNGLFLCLYLIELLLDAHAWANKIYFTIMFCGRMYETHFLRIRNACFKSVVFLKKAVCGRNILHLYLFYINLKEYEDNLQ